MAARAKHAAESAAPALPHTTLFGTFGEWVKQGAEGFIATQKILLDLAAQQNALGITLLRERLGVSLTASNKAPAELAEASVKNFIEAQRVVLDFAQKENTIIGDGIKPRVMGTSLERFTETARLGINNFIAAQRHILGTIETQAEGAVHDFAEGRSFDTSRFTKVARDATRDLLESQRKFLGIVQDQFTTKRDATAKAEAAPERVDFAEMAKSSVDAYVATQQKLLDLGAAQVEASLKFAREIFTGEAAPTTTFADLMKKSADSYMAAQKALMDIAAKSRKPAESEESEQKVVVAVS